MAKINDAVIVSVSISPATKTGVLIVGRKRPNGSTEIVNAFQGEEAVELYTKLTTKVEQTS